MQIWGTAAACHSLLCLTCLFRIKFPNFSPNKYMWWDRHTTVIEQVTGSVGFQYKNMNCISQFSITHICVMRRWHNSYWTRNLQCWVLVRLWIVFINLPSNKHVKQWDGDTIGIEQVSCSVDLSIRMLLLYQCLSFSLNVYKLSNVTSAHGWYQLQTSLRWLHYLIEHELIKHISNITGHNLDYSTCISSLHSQHNNYSTQKQLYDNNNK